MSENKTREDNGKRITIGEYPLYYEKQRNPIEWIILKEDSGTMLLISEYALITTAYCDSEKVNRDLAFLEWQHSLAREICMQFYDTAFSPEEKTLLLCKQSKDGISNCSDYVFLLTEAEVTEYLAGFDLRKAKPSHYALTKGARLGWTEDTREYTSWWLMPEIQDVSPGKIYSSQNTEYRKNVAIYPKAVFQNGDIQYHSRNVYHNDFTIRPCILIDRAKYYSITGNEFPDIKLKLTAEPNKEELEIMVRKRNIYFLNEGYQIDKAGFFFKPETDLRYFRMSNGLLIKIDNDRLTAYRFNNSLKEWNEDSVLFSEYERGNLNGELVFFHDNYPTGKPFSYKSNEAK